MPKVLKQDIYTGDTFPFVLRCRQPDPANPYEASGMPAYPSSAYARAFQSDALTPAFLEVGGAGVYQAPASIDGNLVTYVLPSNFTLPGTYKIFLTMVFPGNVILTENVTIKVLEILPAS